MTDKLEKLLEEVEIEEERLSRHNYSAHFNAVKRAYEGRDYHETLRLIELILSMNDLSVEEVTGAQLIGGFAYYHLGDNSKSKEFLNNVVMSGSAEYMDQAIRGLEKITLREAKEAISERDNLLESRDIALEEASALRRKLEGIKKGVSYLVYGGLGLIALISASIGLTSLYEKCNSTQETSDEIINERLITQEFTDGRSNGSFTYDRDAISETGSSEDLNYSVRQTRETLARITANMYASHIRSQSRNISEILSEQGTPQTNVREEVEEPRIIDVSGSQYERRENQPVDTAGLRRNEDEERQTIDEEVDDGASFGLWVSNVNDDQLSQLNGCYYYVRNSGLSGFLFARRSRSPSTSTVIRLGSDSIEYYDQNNDGIELNFSDSSVDLEDFGEYRIREGRVYTNEGELLNGVSASGTLRSRRVTVIGNQPFRFSAVANITRDSVMHIYSYGEAATNHDLYSNRRYYSDILLRDRHTPVQISARDSNEIREGDRVCITNGVIRLEEQND